MALTRTTFSNPTLLRPFRASNAGRPYADQVKPGNFLLVAHVRPFGHPPGADAVHFQLVAPYESDPRRWPDLDWRNAYEPGGPRYRIATGSPALVSEPDVALVRTYRDVFTAYRVHPEVKALGPDGLPCAPGSRGLLARRPVRPAGLHYVGKESNRLDEVELGLVHDPDEVYASHRRPGEDEWELCRRVLALVPLATLRAESGLSASALKAIRRGSERPREGNRHRLASIAVRHARAALGPAAPEQATACLAAFLDREEANERNCPECGALIMNRRALYCSSRCRQRAHRARTPATG